MPGHTCLVCDYPKLSEPPRSEFGGGSFEICPSCGFQFGVNDDDEAISYTEWRKRWEAKGMPWSSFNIKPPADWKPVAKYVKNVAPAVHSEPAAEPKAEPAPAKKAAKAEKSEKPAKPAAKKAAKKGK